MSQKEDNKTNDGHQTIPVDKTPCGVPGYDELSAGEYAALIQYQINLGHFFTAMTYMELAKKHKKLELIEDAAKAFFHTQSL